MFRVSTDSATPQSHSAPPSNNGGVEIELPEDWAVVTQSFLPDIYCCVTLTPLSLGFPIYKMGQYCYLPCRVVLRMKRGHVYKRIAQCVALNRASINDDGGGDADEAEQDLRLFMITTRWLFFFIRSPATSRFSDLSVEKKREGLSFFDMLLRWRMSHCVIGHISNQNSSII